MERRSATSGCMRSESIDFATSWPARANTDEDWAALPALATEV